MPGWQPTEPARSPLDFDNDAPRVRRSVVRSKLRHADEVGQGNGAQDGARSVGRRAATCTRRRCRRRPVMSPVVDRYAGRTALRITMRRTSRRHQQNRRRLMREGGESSRDFRGPQEPSGWGTLASSRARGRICMPQCPGWGWTRLRRGFRPGRTGRRPVLFGGRWPGGAKTTAGVIAGRSGAKCVRRGGAT